MPAYTEARIRELVSAALAASTEAGVDRVLPELRNALHEHIRLAKESLGAQVVVQGKPQIKIQKSPTTSFV